MSNSEESLTYPQADGEDNLLRPGEVDPVVIGRGHFELHSYVS